MAQYDIDADPTPRSREGQRLAPHAPAAVGIDARLLRDAVGSLADHAGEIRDALDAVVSGI
jgi:hypothetical protein